MNPATNGSAGAPGAESDASDGHEWRTLLRMCGYGFVTILWCLWLLSLQMAPFMFFAFDDEVSTREGLVYGTIQATWVAAIPIALLVAGHLVVNGWTWPEWRIRWLAVAAAVPFWCVIVAFWIMAASSD